MPKQIPLTLPVEPAMGEADFLITPSNQEAAAQLKNAGTADILLLLGPKGSGKSHLARIWANKRQVRDLDINATNPAHLKEAPAWLFEDADRVEWSAPREQNAFHLLNAAREQKKALLITASLPPSEWKLALPDLRSRLLALPVAQIHTPDDVLVAGLLLKFVNDRQLRVSEEVMHYLIPRLPREGAKIEAAVRLLDEAALAGQRAITVPLVKEIFQNSLGFEF